MQVPCKTCTKRYIGCHSSCELYAKFKTSKAELTTKVRDAKYAYYAAMPPKRGHIT